MKGTPLLWAAASAVALKSLLTRLFEPDLWWHLALARQMVAQGQVTRADAFSHTFLGAPYINFEWLAQLGFYGAWAAGGMAGIYVLKIAACVAVAGLCAALFRSWGGRGVPLAVLWWAAFWTLRPRLNERPELATLLALPVLLLLVRVAMTSPQRRRAVSLAGFALMIVWSNAHGGWVFGPALAGLLALGALWAPEHRRSARFLAGFSLLLAAGGLINPYGPHVLFVHTIHLAHLGRAGAVASVIQEWAPTSVASAPVFWALFVSAGAALVAGILRRSPAARLWAPALVAFGAWGALFYRNAGLFAFVAGPFLAMWLAEAPRRSRRWWFLAAPAAVALIPAVPAVTRPLPPTLYQWQRVPVAACEFIAREDIRGRMFNVLEQGGYIEWALGPERKIFIDGRYLFFPLVKELADAVRNGAVPALLERHRVDHAIASPAFFAAAGAGGAALFPPETWALVFWDDAALVYLKRTPDFAAVIGRREYRAFRPDGILPASPAARARARAEADRHRSEVGFSVLRERLVLDMDRTPAPPRP